jgi:hypothetical protein
MANKKGDNGKDKNEASNNDGGKKKSILGALGRKAVEFGKENPTAATVAGAFLIGASWPVIGAAAVLSSKPVRDKIGGLVPEDAKDTIKGVAKSGFEQVGNLKKGLEETLGQGEPETPAEEEKPAAKKGGGRKGPKGLGPKP